MSDSTRRDFIRNTAFAGGTAALSGALSGAAEEQEAKGELVIAQWKGDMAEEAVPAMARKMTERLMAELGGMSRFVKPGMNVWIKPNMAWDRTPEQAACTHPEIVATLVRLCLEADAKTVKVGGNTCHVAKKSYAKSGIEAAAKEAGATVVYLDENRYKDYELGGDTLRKWPLYPEIVESDLVINVPIVKHHTIAKATMCMKNYMGVVGGKRGMWHQNLSGCLVDITRFMKPKLCVLDAIRILTANGPTGGSLKDVKRMNCMAASTDVVAIDAWGADVLGTGAANVESVVAGAKAGLGEMDYEKLNPKKIDVA